MKMKRIILAILTTLVLVGSSYGQQPTLSSVSGIIDEGATLTIDGLYFGDSATILSYDDFEVGTLGDDVENTAPIVGPNWDTQGNIPITYSNDMAWHGDQSIKLTWWDGVTYGTTVNFGWASHPSRPSDGFHSYYMTWNSYRDPDGDLNPMNGDGEFSAENIKNFYWFGMYSEPEPPESDVDWVNQTIGLIPSGQQRWTLAFQDQPAVTLPSEGNPALPIYSDIVNDWHRWEYFCQQESDGADDNDDAIMEWYYHETKNLGIVPVRYYADGMNGAHQTTYVGSNYFSNVRIGHYWVNADENKDHAFMYYDNVYIADGRARVEVGNNAVFANCTHREIQRFTNWENLTGDDYTIDIVLTSSTFDNDEELFVFVVDEDGEASDGFSIGTLGIPRANIDSYEGEVSTGKEVFVYGSDFGQKVPAAPYRYLDFDGKTVGDPVLSNQAGGEIGCESCGGTVYGDGQQRVSGDVSIYKPFGNGVAQTSGTKFNSIDGLSLDEIYISTWMYMDDYAGTATLNNNAKLFTNFAGGTFTNPVSPQQRGEVVWNHPSNSFHFYIENDDDDCIGADDTYLWSKWFDQWYRYERYSNVGTPCGEDGLAYARYNGGKNEVYGEISGNLLTADDEEYNIVLITHFLRGNDGAVLDLYHSCIYVDITQKRIEIGDAQIFEECTHREIQIPTFWSDEEVRFVVNEGTFGAKAEGYLFIINEDGVASLGKPISIGTPVTPTLIAPTNLSGVVVE